MRYELIIIWEDGSKNIYEYENRSDAQAGEQNFVTAFGNQVSWHGIREKR